MSNSSFLSSECSRSSGVETRDNNPALSFNERMSQETSTRKSSPLLSSSGDYTRISVFPEPRRPRSSRRRYQENSIPSQFAMPPQRTNQVNVANTLPNNHYPPFPLPPTLHNQVPPCVTTNPSLPVPYLGILALEALYHTGIDGVQPNGISRHRMPNFSQNPTYTPNVPYPQTNANFSQNPTYTTNVPFPQTNANFSQNPTYTPNVPYPQTNANFFTNGQNYLPNIPMVPDVNRISSSVQYPYYVANNSRMAENMHIPFFLRRALDETLTVTDEITEIVNDNQQIRIKLVVYSFTKEELRFKIVDGSLIVEGRIINRPDECDYGSVSRTFIRKFPLPNNIRGGEIVSSFEDGILTFTIPKGP